jgi:hypothetical protein
LKSKADGLRQLNLSNGIPNIHHHMSIPDVWPLEIEIWSIQPAALLLFTVYSHKELNQR